MSNCLTILEDFPILTGHSQQIGLDEEFDSISGKIIIPLNEVQLRAYEECREIYLRVRSVAGHLGLCIKPTNIESQPIIGDTNNGETIIEYDVEISCLNRNLRLCLNRLLQEKIPIGSAFLPSKPLKSKKDIEKAISNNSIVVGHNNYQIVDSPDESGYCIKLPLTGIVYDFDWGEISRNDNFLKILQIGRKELFKKGIRLDERKDPNLVMQNKDFLITSVQILSLNNVHADVVSTQFTDIPGQIIHTSATLLHANRTGKDQTQTQNGHNPSNTHLEICNTGTDPVEIFKDGYVLLKLYHEVITPHYLQTSLSLEEQANKPM